MINWVRPSGSEITTADTENLKAYGESQGWKVKEDKPKRTRRTKAEMEASDE